MPDIRRSPDRLTDDRVQDYLLYLLKEKGLAWNTCNVYFSGIKNGKKL
ncbi:MAG: hypothetical protein GXP56_11920 [Deltaproteobacteria bacterium]|nr:hypothetical protein [Deltaproteobacteria bacterium]